MGRRVGGRYRHRDPGGGQEGSFHPLLPCLERDAAGHSRYRSRPFHHPDDHRRPRRRAEPSIGGRQRHDSHRAAPPRPHRGPRGISRPPTLPPGPTSRPSAPSPSPTSGPAAPPPGPASRPPSPRPRPSPGAWYAVMSPRGSILSQALVAFSAFAVLIAIAAAVGYMGLAHQNSATKQLTGQDYVIQQAAGQMQEAFTVSQLSISGFALSGRRASLLPISGERSAFAETHLFAGAAAIAKLPSASASARRLASGTSRIAQNFYQANSALQEVVAVNIRQLTAHSKRSLSVGLAWSAAAIAVAVALILMACLSTVRGIARPLGSLAATVRRLTSGDHAARAKVTGSAEVREVAQSVNTMARENDRLRGQEQEHTRLRALAREAG